jgi:hypothetical protein
MIQAVGGMALCDQAINMIYRRRIATRGDNTVRGLLTSGSNNTG